jgi:hypothetical protein
MNQYNQPRFGWVEIIIFCVVVYFFRKQLGVFLTNVRDYFTGAASNISKEDKKTLHEMLEEWRNSKGDSPQSPQTSETVVTGDKLAEYNATTDVDKKYRILRDVYGMSRPEANKKVKADVAKQLASLE